MQFIRAVATCLLLSIASLAWGQGYPEKSKPIRIILPQGPGSASDVIARAFASAITETAGLNAIVEYKPGAEAIIGVQALMSAPRDGYSVLLVSSSTPVINPVLIPNLPYDPLRDFIPLVGISKVSLAFNLGPSTPFKSAREFVAAAKANPGKYTFASSTTTTRLSGELLQSLAGIKLLNVPYKTSAAAGTALASGEVDLLMIDPASIKPLTEGGRVRTVAVSGSSRLRALPSLPTLQEEGVAGYDVTAWYATYFAAKTPPDIVKKAIEILRKAALSPAFTEALAKAAMEPLDQTPDEITAQIRKEIDLWTKVVKAANLRPN